MPKTIAIDGSRAFVDEKTGTENYSYQLIKNIALIDAKSKYLIYIRAGQKPGKNWPGNFQFTLINFHRLWTQVGLSIQLFKDKPDLLFVPSHTVPLIKPAKLVTVMTVHDLGAEYLPTSHQLKQQLYLKFITAVQLKSVSKLIAVSKATKEDLVKKIGITPKKIEVIYEGVDQSFFKPVKSDVLIDRLRHYDIDNKRYFLFVGTIQPRKNILRLIEAFKEFLDKTQDTSMKLVIVGGKGWDYEEIISHPEKLGLNKQVVFLGRVPDQDLPALYTGALAFVFPSLFEGFGLPILEAMACGCPVISSNNSSLKEIVSGAGLEVNPLSVSEIAQAMIK